MVNVELCLVAWKSSPVIFIISHQHTLLLGHQRHNTSTFISSSIFYLPVFTFTFITHQLVLFPGHTKPLLSLTIFTICHFGHPLSLSSNVGKLTLVQGRQRSWNSTFTFILHFECPLSLSSFTFTFIRGSPSSWEGGTATVALLLLSFFTFEFSLSLSSLAHPHPGKVGRPQLLLSLLPRSLFFASPLSAPVHQVKNFIWIRNLNFKFKCPLSAPMQHFECKL